MSRKALSSVQQAWDTRTPGRAAARRNAAKRLQREAVWKELQNAEEEEERERRLAEDRDQ